MVCLSGSVSSTSRVRRSGRHARVPFTAAQAAALEAAYARAPYLAPPALRALAAALQLRDDRVNIFLVMKFVYNLFVNYDNTTIAKNDQWVNSMYLFYTCYSLFSIKLIFLPDKNLVSKPSSERAKREMFDYNTTAGCYTTTDLSADKRLAARTMDSSYRFATKSANFTGISSTYVPRYFYRNTFNENLYLCTGWRAKRSMW